MQLRRRTAYLLYPDGLCMVVSMSWYSCQDSHLPLFLCDAARLGVPAPAFLHVTKHPSSHGMDIQSLQIAAAWNARMLKTACLLPTALAPACACRTPLSCSCRTILSCKLTYPASALAPRRLFCFTSFCNALYPTDIAVGTRNATAHAAMRNTDTASRSKAT
jgi:hypothetical protein